ncbi:hypothetical protein D3C85_1725390 [compost metagenome]
MNLMLIRYNQISILEGVYGFLDKVVHITTDEEENFTALMQMEVNIERRLSGGMHKMYMLIDLS